MGKKEEEQTKINATRQEKEEDICALCVFVSCTNLYLFVLY